MDNTKNTVLSTFEKFKVKTEMPFFILLMVSMLLYFFFDPISKEQLDTLSYGQIEDMLFIHKLTTWGFISLFSLSFLYACVYLSHAVKSNKMSFVITLVTTMLMLAGSYAIKYQQTDITYCYATPNFIAGQSDQVKQMMKDNLIVVGSLVKKEYFDIQEQTIVSNNTPYLIKDVINLAAYQQKPH